MPLGFERLNERQQRPNANINFIKPLEGPDKATAEDFLQRIAAQCYPVMKKHYISVMSLEEFPPNREFLGRNFNAGEVIQLVLKDRGGRWLSLKFVQMVMMHELAHCKQMNHSRFFWNVRNEYAKQMEELWRQNYVGEGIWGRGRGLQTGRFVHDRPPDQTQIPEHLCGGSYRRRGRKRKRGNGGAEEPAKLTYAERQQRRIARKFGKHGEGASLGDDELIRGALESMNGGKRAAGKPRVANSKRGRELRANAALARFEQSKVKKEQPEEDLGSETESDWDEDASSAANDVTIKDEHGHDLIKVCGDEAEDDRDGAQHEMDDLRTLGYIKKEPGTESSTLHLVDQAPADLPPTKDREASRSSVSQLAEDRHIHENSETESETEDSTAGSRGAVPVTNGYSKTEDGAEERPAQQSTTETAETSAPTSGGCPICSLENPPDTPTCIACAHVLRPGLMPDHWQCRSEACQGSKYVNAGDAGRCGVCGASKPTKAADRAGSGRDMGVTQADVLRWD